MRSSEVFDSMAKILIKNGRVFDGYRFLNADVLINGKTIERIEPDIISEGSVYVYHANGRIVSAGFVDMHTHMRVLPSDPYGVSADLSTLPFGVTAAADAGRTHGESAVFDSFTVKSVVFVTVHIRSNQAQLESIEEDVSRFGKRVVGLKVFFDATMSEATDITPLREICSFAHRKGLRVMVHCSSSPTPMEEILNTLKKGDILTHAFHGGSNNASEDGFACIKAAKARGIVIDAGYAGRAHTDFRILREAIEAGVAPDTISTDITGASAYTRGGRYGMTMCMSYSRHLGMTEEEVLRAVTSTPARALGKENEWGTLKVGGAADVTVLDYADEGFDITDRAGNRIWSSEGYRCVLTVSNGRIVYKR